MLIHYIINDVRSYQPLCPIQFHIMAQYNHPYGIIQFKKWDRMSSYKSEDVGIWYNHPALVVVWKFKSPLFAI